MSHATRVATASMGYLSEAVPATLWTLSILLIVTWPMLLLGWSAGGQFTAYTIFGYLGLCIYIAQLELEDKTTRVSNVADSNFLRGLLALLMVIYYNLVLFVAVIIAGSTAIAGYSNIALAIAAIYPVYDAEMAKVPYPFSIAGTIVIASAFIASSIQWIEQFLDLDYHNDVIESVRQLQSSTSILHEFTASQYRRVR